MSRFLDPKLQTLEPYTPGEQPRNMAELIKLNTNECPFSPSPKVLEVVDSAAVRDLRLYSDPACKALVEAIAAYNGVNAAQVIPGNGSDEILAFLFHGFCPKGAVFPDITYGFYKVFADMFKVPAVQVPLREDFSVEVEDYAEYEQTVFLANPNAPSGRYLPLTEIEKLLKQKPDRLVVIDEAYVEFGCESAVKLLARHENLIVVRTFSKSHALAGARLGYALGSESLIRDVNTLKFSFNPYNINRLTLLAGKAAIEDTDYFAACREKIIASRNYTTKELRLLGFQVPESGSNFVFAGGNPGISGDDYYRALREKGILVRHWDSPRIRDYVRITIGTQAQMEQLIAVTKELI